MDDVRKLVKVKPLEWYASTDIPGLHNAESPICWWYNVHELNDGRFKYEGDPCALPQNVQPSAHPTLEAAKAAAQADYEARIYAALTPASDGRAEGLREAAGIARAFDYSIQSSTAADMRAQQIANAILARAAELEGKTDE
jgi:hypothetical protein